MVTRLNQALADPFGPLPKTLLFRYRTLAEVAGHLARDHTDACRRWTGMAPAVAPASEPMRAQPTPARDQPFSLWLEANGSDSAGGTPPPGRGEVGRGQGRHPKHLHFPALAPPQPSPCQGRVFGARPGLQAAPTGGRLAKMRIAGARDRAGGSGRSGRR